MDPTIKSIRAFNRFYARTLGLYDTNAVHTDYSYAQARIIYEIGTHPGCFAQFLSSYLSIDKGYLSRLIDGLEKKHLLYKQADAKDSRKKALFLSEEGKEEFTRIDEASNAYIEEVLKEKNPQERILLKEAMQVIMKIMEAKDVTD